MAGVLRLHSLAAKSFWFDEGVSVAIARLDWYNFARILWRREANMSLYYLLLHFWLYFGGSEFFIRALSVLFAVASIPLMYLLGRRLFDSRVGMAAAALLAVNAYHVQYSQDARSYSLVVLLCLLSSLYFVKTLDDPSAGNRATWVLTSALAVYAQFFSLLLVVAQWLSVRILDRELAPLKIKHVWRWIAFLISPVLVFVATTGTGPLRWVQRPNLQELWTFGLHLTGNGGTLLFLGYLGTFVAALSFALRSCAETQPLSQPWGCRFLALWLIFPIALTLLVTLVKPLFVPRYFTFCLPALLLLVAAGVAQVRFWWLRIAVLIVLLSLSFRGTTEYYTHDVDIQRDDWRAVSRYLLNQVQPGDALLFHVPMGRMPYEFYRSLSRPTSASPVVLYPHHADGRLTFLDFVEKPDEAEIERSLASHPRVWMVLTYAETQMGLADARSQELTALVGKTHFLAERHDFSGVEVLLYTTNRAP